MKTTVSRNDFVDAFRAHGRINNFSIEALDSLFEYLEQWEAETGEEAELDVVALCCDYSEDTVEAIAANYSIDLSDYESDEEKRQAVFDYLSDNTSVVSDTVDGFVYANF